ncbi:helix-turn-helix domain-containing protein [Methylobacterium mesophilicum SR1.6/6]|uniref:Helix-turn-helix domain-containing protein n=1 Tax=Methylobacterium mesophilicum SR1.6/6 TaxID=908290 RepID=A0A6B9FSF3_9HYPH|nr:helix-turn-helix domain-containing protein [Methylobacterium mesophilicum SR1.6/6]
MSIEAIHFIMKTEIPDGIAKLVAFVIADYAHAETGQAWPKIETLARKCSQSVRTVQRKIRVLEELGILRVEQRHAETGRQRENLFVLYLPGVPRPAANDPTSPRPEARPKRGEGDTQSPIPPPDPVTLGGVSPVTPEGDTAVTPRGIPQKESTRRESPRRETRDSALPPRPLTRPRPPRGLPLPGLFCVPMDSRRRGTTTRRPRRLASTPPSSGRPRPACTAGPTPTRTARSPGRPTGRLPSTGSSTPRSAKPPTAPPARPAAPPHPPRPAAPRTAASPSSLR